MAVTALRWPAVPFMELPDIVRHVIPTVARLSKRFHRPVGLAPDDVVNPEGEYRREREW